MRFRYTYMGIGSILVILLGIFGDPRTGLITSLPFGVDILANIIVLSKAVLYVALLHLSRKALLDYLNLQELFSVAKKTPEGAGNATIGVGLIYIALAITIYAATA